MSTPLKQALIVSGIVAAGIGLPTIVASTMDVKLPYRSVWAVTAAGAVLSGGWTYGVERSRSGRPLIAPSAPRRSSTVEEAAIGLGVRILDQASDRVPDFFRAAEAGPVPVEVDRMLDALPIAQPAIQPIAPAQSTEEPDAAILLGSGLPLVLDELPNIPDDESGQGGDEAIDLDFTDGDLWGES